MAERANWKGNLKLSLVSCPIQLFPATQSQKISFNMINPKTGSRLKQQMVDAGTGEKVERSDTVRGFEVEKDQYVTVTDEELEAVKLETKHSINIDAFVKKSEIDERYIERPYYIVPDEDGDDEAFAVIREALRRKGMVAIGQIILQRRENIIAIEPYKQGMVGYLLRYPTEIRASGRYFSEIKRVDVDDEMVDLASTIIDKKTTAFKPDQFKDHYEDAVRELLEEKRKGAKITTSVPKSAGGAKVIDLMAALRKSVGAEPGRRAAARRTDSRGSTKSSAREKAKRRA
jgi:DNA end-binding protein Ku